jgi:hypothetical protein
MSIVSARLWLAACLVLLACRSRSEGEDSPAARTGAAVDAPPEAAFLANPETDVPRGGELPPEAETIDAVLGLNAHLVVMKSRLFDTSAIANRVMEIAKPAAMQPFIFMEVNATSDVAAVQAAVLKGVPSGWDKVLSTARHLSAGSLELTWHRRDQPAPAIVGTGVANKLGLALGSEFEVNGNQDDLPELRVEPIRLQVVGMMQTGFPEYDRRLILADIAAARAMLNPSDESMGLELSFAERDLARSVAPALRRELGSEFKILDWCELNAQLFMFVCRPFEKVAGTRTQHETGCTTNQDAASCRALARMWEAGQGGAQDSRKARELYARACAQADAASCRQLALFWAIGRGGPVHFVTSYRFYEKACKLRDLEACGELGMFLRNVKHDRNRAELLLSFACERGAPKACADLGELRIADDSSARARAPLARACKSDVAVGCDLLASLEDGRTRAASTKLLEKAQGLYQQKCQGGYAAACVRAREIAADLELLDR